MPIAGRSWIGATAVVVTVGSALAAIFPVTALLVIPVVGGIMLLRFREQRLLLLSTFVVATAVSYVASGWGHAVYAVMGITLPGLIIAETRQRGYGLSLALLLGCLPAIITVFAFYRFFVGVFDLYVLTLENLTASPEISAFYPADQLETVVQYISWWAEHAVYYLPAMFLTTIVSYYFFGALLGEYVIARSGTFIKRVPQFILWKAPEWTIVVLGVSAIMILSGINLLEVLGWNALVFQVVLFSVFGISLLEYYMRRAHLPVAVRVLVYVALFIMQFVAGVLLPLAALFDAKYDFRKIRAKRFG